MIWTWFLPKTFLLCAVLLATNFPLIQGNTHNIEKRQIGVLARTGALPQGKRSVEVLARNGELPPLIGGKRDTNSDQTLDLLIHELDNAESLSKLRIQALTERFVEEKESEDGPEFGKRSVAALARNGELPQKKSGYLVRPSQETIQPTKDLFDPDDFLAEVQLSNIAEYLDEKPPKNFFIRNDKRNLGFAWHYPLRRQGYLKNRIGRSGGSFILKHPFTQIQRRNAEIDFDRIHDEEKRNLGATKNFGKREINENCLEAFNHNDKGNSKRSKRNAYVERSQEEYEMPFFQNSEESDYEDFPAEFYKNEGTVTKRFLGRIPQLGRIHQKVQSPSSRRRPHLRPNWL